MSPSEFFQKAGVGCRIQYGRGECRSPVVEITYINRSSMYAWAIEEGTGRRVWLFLSRGLLCDETWQNSFGTIEVVT
jgi:hypothetical protein